MLSDIQIDRFARQLIVSDIGPEGQWRLLQARVLVPRLDVAGRACAVWLARAGVGTIRIPDDTLPVGTDDHWSAEDPSVLGRARCEVVRSMIARVAPDSQVLVEQDASGEGMAAALDGLVGGAAGALAALQVIRRILREEDRPVLSRVDG